MRFYGRATSSSSCAPPLLPDARARLCARLTRPTYRHAPDGGYGGTDTNYRYFWELPDTWKTDTVSKVEKATNGTDARFVDPVTKGASGL